METYNPKKIESKWQRYWEEKKLFQTPADATEENKFYILPQLPYPSGSGLHVGHAEVYNACDIYARYQRMTGKKVLQVIGWDSFGLPAENYAIKTNVHPRKSTDDAVNNFRHQIKSLGISVDWEREVGSHNPDYYQWTQWFFQLFYKQGLAYRKNQAVNWCESCKTVLANAQVVEGHCERCDTVVAQKEMEQWYIKITDYADKLLEGLDRIDWPEETKKRQRDWIGRSPGIEIDFRVDGTDDVVTVFTTTPVNYGATFIVVAPEHPIIERITTPEQKEVVQAYVDNAANKTDLERQTGEKKKTGVFTGSYVINHVTGEKLPVWVADFVLYSFGTGAVQGCPAHDERDFEFAAKFDIPIIRVVEGKDGQTDKFVDPKTEVVDQVKIGKGINRKMINSEQFNGLPFDEGMAKTMDYFEEQGWGRRVTTYKLRDWSVSRQRFWGAPIPMIRNMEHGIWNTEQGMPERVVHLHGWESFPEKHFRPWLTQQEEALGIESITPALPDTNIPVREKWLAASEEALGSETEKTVLEGRSLGCWTALEVAQSHRLRKLILVAPVVPTEEWYAQFRSVVSDKKAQEVVTSFVTGDLDYKAIEENVGEVVVCLSTNDPYIPLKSTEAFFAKHLPFARIVRVRDAGHFGADDGYETFKQLLDEITAPVRPDLRPVLQEDLPVILPEDVDFKPTGESPLNYSPSFNDGVEEKYGAGWKREPDTLDTFMCSSWYYYRYLDPKNSKAFASPQALKDWMPVDFYLGGEEHVNGHLLYSRFFTKVLYDAGYIDFDEPFTKHRHQGLILGEDNRKMSKRWGNVINPTDVVHDFGADTVRTYQMFMGPLEDTKPWSTDGVRGVRKFLDRVWRLQEKVGESESQEVTAELHKTIKKVSDDMPVMKFNTSIAKMMELTNVMTKAESITAASLGAFMKILCPFAPHIAEEIWEALGNEPSVTTQDWPSFDESYLVQDEVEIVVQVNGKVRDKFTIARDADEEAVKTQALSSAKIKKWLDGKEPKKVIVIKGKLVSIVV